VLRQWTPSYIQTVLCRLQCRTRMTWSSESETIHIGRCTPSRGSARTSKVPISPPGLSPVAKRYSSITIILSCIDSIYHDSSLPSELILDLAEEAFDTMTLFLFTSFNLLMLITHKGSHGSSQRTHAFTHPRTFGGEDDSLHSSLSVVPTIIRTIGGVVARRHNSVNILDLLF
jgi:hypothetical protein